MYMEMCITLNNFYADASQYTQYISQDLSLMVIYFIYEHNMLHEKYIFFKQCQQDKKNK